MQMPIASYQPIRRMQYAQEQVGYPTSTSCSPDNKQLLKIATASPLSNPSELLDGRSTSVKCSSQLKWAINV